MKDPKLFFTEAATHIILEALDKRVDENGYVFDLDTGEFTLDVDGKKFKWNQIKGIVSKAWITNFNQLSKI